MFLSRLIVNSRDRGVRRDLANPYDLHRTLLRAFPDDVDGGPKRILFRVEAEPNTASVVLVQSNQRPNWFALPADYLLEADMKSLDELVFATGQRLRFRLRANPTRRLSGKAADPLAGKRVGLLGDDERSAWMVRKAANSGFRLFDHQLRIVPEGKLLARKGDQTLSFESVRFEGCIEVHDSARFLQTLAEGIGSAKGLGFGLLSVAQAED